MVWGTGGDRSNNGGSMVAGVGGDGGGGRLMVAVVDKTRQIVYKLILQPRVGLFVYPVESTWVYYMAALPGEALPTRACRGAIAGNVDSMFR